LVVDTCLVPDVSIDPVSGGYGVQSHPPPAGTESPSASIDQGPVWVGLAVEVGAVPGCWAGVVDTAVADVGVVAGAAQPATHSRQADTANPRRAERRPALISGG
jgi:hypothetical protein